MNPRSSECTPVPNRSDMEGPHVFESDRDASVGRERLPGIRT